MSLRDRFSKAKQAAASAASKPATEIKPSGNVPAKPLHPCGHPINMRAIKVQDCPNCIANRRRKATAERLAKLELDKQSIPSDRDTSGRLPDGSSFGVIYDATRQMWHGALSVPNMPSIKAEASGVMKLLRVLDDLYRKAIAK